MKRIFLALTLLLGVSLTSFAQGTIPPFTLTSSTQTGPAPTINLTGTGTTQVTFTWYKFGTISAGACALQGSADNVTFGTTVIAAQTVTSSGAYSTLTATTSNYLRISCTTPISGSGRVTFKVLIYGPVASGGGGGAVTIANGASVALGSTTDDRCQTTDPTACTVIGLEKQTNYLLNNPVCNLYVFDRSNTADVQLVAASGSTIIYICGYSIVGESTTGSDVNLRWATASDCTTGATSLTPPLTVGTSTSGGMVGGKAIAPSGWNGLASPSTRNLCVHRSAAQTSAVEVWYGQR